ncbi:MAG: SAM-dependent chlorinase/fluorinase [Candidatus Magnetomorum sp.]|nr:SAM-dependent chlorinase/fluorinase [Candidatus Magnetomorum sp.]
MKPSCISLITDFGLSDEYVGVMKGVIASINPHTTVIDITHHIAPQNIIQAAYTLWFSYAYFPQNTVHVVVVDPGVGSTRKIVALKTEKAYFLAPDNGVLSLILNEHPCTAVYVDRSEFFLKTVSGTFHGRDIFAPVAAHLSKTRNLYQFGSTIPSTQVVTLSNPLPYIENDTLFGQVVMTDHFGNIISNISEKDLDRIGLANGLNESACIHIKDKRIAGIVGHYGQCKKGELLAILGSKGFLEISINCGNASQEIAVEIGCQICITKNNDLTK